MSKITEARNNIDKNSTVYRNIVECSCMSNNDEYSFYTSYRLDRTADLLQFVPSNSFNQPHLVISRRVQPIEIEQGLGFPVRTCHTFDEKVPEITKILDSVYSIIDAMKFRQTMSRKPHLDEKTRSIWADPSIFLADIIATNYYDCMSAGMPTYTMALIRYIIETYKPNRSTEVYPGKDGDATKWYTLQDFYDSTNKTKQIPEIKYLPANLEDIVF